MKPLVNVLFSIRHVLVFSFCVPRGFLVDKLKPVLPLSESLKQIDFRDNRDIYGQSIALNGSTSVTILRVIEKQNERSEYNRSFDFL